MSLFSIVLKNLRQRALSSTLTAASIALGVGVVVAVLALKAQGQEAFRQSAVGYDLVVGPKGGRLQLVLNVVYHLDEPPGIIPYAVYERLKADRRVRLAAPVAVGDTWRGFRLVGSSDRLLRDFEIAPGRNFELAAGRVYAFDEDKLSRVMSGGAEEGVFEAVAGSATGLRVGETFAARHGGETGDEHDEKWTVVGVLAPTGTPNDRAIFINLESFFHIKGHQAEQETRGKISAVLLQTRGLNAAQDLAWELNNGPDAMAVQPAAVMGELFQMIGQVDVLLLAVAGLVNLVAAVSSVAARSRS
jgi:putative ABC transport system permease protein